MTFPTIVGSQYTSPEQVTLSVAKKVTDFNNGNFAIADSDGNTLFKLEQKKVFLGADLTVLRDAKDCPVVSIKKKGFSLHDTYEVAKGVDEGDLFVLKDKFLNDKSNETYVIQLEGAEEADFEVTGDFVRRNYQIVYQHSTIVAEVSKKFSISSFFTGKNKYAVKLSPNADQAFVAAIVTIMEAIHNEIKEKSGDGDKSSDEED